MLNAPMDQRVTVARDDLRVAAVVVSVRLPEPSAERRRLILVDELLRVESNLGRVLAEHARHALAESRGSHSTWDVVADAEQVFAVLEQYESTVQRIASEYRALVASITTEEGETATDGSDVRRGE